MADDVVRVRDSKTEGSPVLRFRQQSWKAFVRTVTDRRGDRFRVSTSA